MSEKDITVYWRPGCMFCSSLLRGLERAGLSFAWVDIWQEEQGAAFVRRVASGHETVPTVRVGGVALVNPSTRDVLRTVAAEAPDQLPQGYEPPLAGVVGRTVSRLLGHRVKAG